MRRALWVGALGVALLGVAGVVVALRPQREWTSPSSAAVAEVELGRQAETKYYMSEAKAHYEKALALDPDFVAAKLLLARSLDGSDTPRVAALLGEVRAVPPGRLTAGEQFLVRYTLARFDHRAAEATELLDAYLAAHPHDAAALFSRCTEEWLRPDWDAAERCNRELLEVDPNWVLAYNYLGYIAMAQGRFSEAEKDFLAYRYIAPDQANPYDSLGELYTVQGRYEEARAELEAALRLRPDFCGSYAHLMLVANLTRDVKLADELIARAAGGGLCQPKQVEGMKCAERQWKQILAGDLDGAWSAAVGACLEDGDLPVVAHRVAVLSGRLAEARSLEDGVRKRLEETPAPAGSPFGLLRGAARHMEGVRTMVEGRPTEAVALLQEADAALVFQGEGQGVLKLVNQLALAEALRASGASAHADEIVTAVAAVNPRIAGVFGDHGPLCLTCRAAGVTSARRSRFRAAITQPGVRPSLSGRRAGR